MGGTAHWSKSVSSFPLEQEGAAETMCDKLTMTPFPVLRVLLAGERENLGVKLNQGKKEGWGKGIFKFCFDFSIPCPDLIGNKVCFGHGGNW